MSIYRAPHTTSLIRIRWSEDVPAIRPQERQACQDWLQSTGFLQDDENGRTWDTIRQTWVRFLTATKQGKRNVHHVQRRAIQTALWDGMDGLEALSERWPEAARLALNRHLGEGDDEPFESLAARWLLEKRRRFQAMWTGLVCFLAWAVTEASLQDIGLVDSEDLSDDLLDLVQAATNATQCGAWDGLQVVIQGFLTGLIKDRRANVKTNPLLWWTAVLARSAVSADDEEVDYISRGRFTRNILPIDVELRDRVEAIAHYSKVLVLDRAIHGWKGNPTWIDEIIGELNLVDNNWLNEESGPRPDPSLDRRQCSSVAWQVMLRRIEKQRVAYLGETEGTAMYGVLALKAALESMG